MFGIKRLKSYIRDLDDQIQRYQRHVLQEQIKYEIEIREIKQKLQFMEQSTLGGYYYLSPAREGEFINSSETEKEQG